MDRKCCICGRRFPENEMERVFVGRVLWRCWDCYKKGHGEVAGVEIANRGKREKEWNK